MSKKLREENTGFGRGGKIPEGKNEGIIYCENSHDFNSEVLIYFGITACLTCFTLYIYIYSSPVFYWQNFTKKKNQIKN